jgi:uncharacterized protein with PQ loop repeat
MKKKEQPAKWKRYYEVFILIWAIFSPTWLLLGAIKIFQTQDAGGVSLASYVLVLLGNIIWLIYGCWVLERRNWVIIGGAIPSAILAIVVIIGICLYPSRLVCPTVTVTVSA